MKRRKMGNKLSAWVLCLAMVLAMVNLPMFISCVKAEDASGGGDNIFMGYCGNNAVYLYNSDNGLVVIR